jgi:adenosyl cobinamide kinase/adenosyl cobinamide phosphate guanylyltransferase
MTKKFEQILSESGFDKEAKAQIQEAWDSKLAEAKEVQASELREEFAQRFEHDKSVLVESIDSFLSNKIKEEMKEFAADREKLIAERIQYKNNVKKHAEMLNKFVTETVAKEVKELHGDKVAMKENVTKLENFVLQQLAEEIKDFHSDKKELVEQRVKLVREGKAQLQEAKKAFIERASKLVETTINNTLRSEITQLKEDITAARENEFGRKLFETFRKEFLSSHLNEGTEVSKFKKQLDEQKALNESLKSKLAEGRKLLESAQIQAKASKDLANRKEIMSEMLRPLNASQRTIMKDLLESTQTSKLEATFNKYLPTVLNETAETKAQASKETLTEGQRTVKTGDKVEKGTAHDNSDVVELDQIRKLAGLN